MPIGMSLAHYPSTALLRAQCSVPASLSPPFLNTAEV